MSFCSMWKQIFTIFVTPVLFILRQNWSEQISFVNNKYGDDDIDDLITIVNKQTAMSSIASQSHGSIKNSDNILVIDTDDSIFWQKRIDWSQWCRWIRYIYCVDEFKLIRQVARWFEHIVRTKLWLGNVGKITHRSIFNLSKALYTTRNSKMSFS